MALVRLILLFLFCYDTRATNKTIGREDGLRSDKLMPVSFPSKADTLAYVDALKHSNFSQWRSLEEVAKRAGGGSCPEALNTSVLTALYLLGLFNLCAASPASCCIASDAAENRRKRRSDSGIVKDSLPPLLNSLTQNLSSLPLERFGDLPQISTPHGGKVPVHISVVEQVRKLWDSNPRLLSNVPCTTATEALRSSFISLSGVASGIILAYSIAQLNQCYPDHQQENGDMNKIWFFPIPKQQNVKNVQFLVRSLPSEIPVQGEDDRDDDCARYEVLMGDGSCERLLSSRVCPYMQWILLNRETGKGECYPRLCSEGKVFVEFDQLCHDVNEPGFCPENQRLYLTAWGEAVCDCLDGMFYGPDKKCHRIYDQGYCYKGTVLQFHKPSKTLVCKTDHCKKLNDLLPQHELPFVKSEDNSCYQFGSTGPCEESEQYGFNIEELAPSCVGLEEAGLIRPHRSYQYSHMSFPSFPDKDFPHYEVSYVILNGSTWELKMRTVGGRQKRDIQDFLYENHTVIPFIDTREFPNSIKDISNKFQELQSDVIKQNQNKDEMIKETPLALYEKVKKNRLSNMEQMHENIFFHKDETKEIKSENITQANGNVNNHLNPRESDLMLDELIDNESRNVDDIELGPNIENNTKGSYVSEINIDNTTINLEDYGKMTNSTEINIDNNTINLKDYGKMNNSTENSTEINKNILIKVLSGKSRPCKWEVSFYSQMPNASISFNSTSINLLSHPNLDSFRINNEEEKQKIKFEEMNLSEESTTKKEDVLDSFSNDNNIKNKNDTDYIKKDESKNNQLNDIRKENLSANNFFDTNVEIMSTIKETPSAVLEQQGLETRLVYITNDTSQLISTKDISDNLHIVNDTNHIKQNENKIITEEDMTRADVREDDTEIEEQQHIAKEDKKIEEIIERGNQIIKISQQEEISSTKKSTASNKNFNEIFSRQKGKRRRKKKKRKKLKKKKKRNKIKSKIRDKDIERSNKINPNQYSNFDDVIIVEKISQDSNSLGPGSSESGNKNIFLNQSLPDYLKNRGRRQAGSRKGLKLGPGIINAPLLNQCRPGAKRDYNGYCRPKIIPSARVPSPRRHAKSKYYEPTPPRMKCKEEKRLDSRGVCRTTFSGLG